MASTFGSGTWGSLELLLLLLLLSGTVLREVSYQTTCRIRLENRDRKTLVDMLRTLLEEGLG